MKRLGFIALSIGLLGLASCGGSDPSPGDPKNPVLDMGRPVVVVMDTSKGKVTMELYPDKAPITVANFLNYVDKKHYDGTIFHRVIPTFMVQGGGMVPGMREKSTDAPIRNEASNGLKNLRGTLAMARTNVPDSATSQFFINVVDNAFLDRANAQDRVGYAVFGKVIDGMDVVDEIRFVPTRSDVPVTDILIKSIRRVETKKE
jgi:cyclophilin family peptidyl-prolyl cis-trans isomerase